MLVIDGTAHRLEVGVDYMTTTAAIGSEQAERIIEYGLQLCRDRQKQGEPIQATRVLGFDGFSSGTTVFYGQSHNTAMLRVSGEDSNSAFKTFNRIGYHYTRLDIQVTCWCNGWPDNYGELCYEQFCKPLPSGKESKSVPRTTKDKNGGWTVYSSARTAKQMARVYNKYAETPEEHYKGAIRYELELKDVYATEMAAMLQFQSHIQEEYISTYLAIWFKSKGIILPYAPRTTDISPLSIPHRESDTETKLRWLERQVKPTVQRLIDMGLREYVTMLLFGTNSSGEVPDDNDYQ
jgi:hypothetical protein